MLGDHVYGHSESKGWVCLDLKTGQVAWNEKSKQQKGSICAADGMLYLRSEAGDGTVPLYATRGDGILNYYIEETHDSLPGNPQVIDAVLALAHGQKPTLASEDPYGRGWILKLKAPNLATNLRNLLSGRLARKWMEDSREAVFHRSHAVRAFVISSFQICSRDAASCLKTVCTCCTKAGVSEFLGGVEGGVLFLLVSLGVWLTPVLICTSSFAREVFPCAQAF